MQGSIGVLFASEFVVVNHSCPERRSIHRCFCTCLDRVGRGDMANTAIRRKDVSRLHGLRSKRAANN